MLFVADQEVYGAFKSDFSVAQQEIILIRAVNGNKSYAEMRKYFLELRENVVSDNFL